MLVNLVTGSRLHHENKADGLQEQHRAMAAGTEPVGKDKQEAGPGFQKVWYTMNLWDIIGISHRGEVRAYLCIKKTSPGCIRKL